MNIRISQTVSATLLAAALASPALSEQYVCTDDTQTGFFFNSNTESWVSSQLFEDHAFLVDTDAETISKFGQSGIIYDADDCKNAYNDVNDNDYMACHSFETMTGMIINRDLLRFSRTYYAGYVTGDTEREASFVAIGTCAELGG